jgi:hypothetical protein
MNYSDELSRLTNCLTNELKAKPKRIVYILSYLIQSMLCVGAVVAMAIFNLLNKMADEMEAGQGKARKKQPPRPKKDTGLNIPVTVSEKCRYGLPRYCNPKCRFWKRTFDGGGFCTKDGWGNL